MKKLLTVCALLSTPLMAQNNTVEFDQLRCGTSTHHVDPQLSMGFNKHFMDDDDITLDMRYTITFNKEVDTTHCDKITKLIEDRMTLENEIRKLELQQLKEAVKNGEPYRPSYRW